MNSLNIIESLYKPSKITLKKSIYIIDNKYILKKENKDLNNLYNYLSSRDINNYPSLVRNLNNNDNLLEYIEPLNIPIEQKLSEMGKLVGYIHNKTIYQKNITNDEIKEIKENVENNIIYLNNKYHSYIKNLLLKSFLTPKEYYFIRNYYIIQNALDFCSSEINNWYLLKEKDNNIRISLIHNNLLLEHFIISKDKNYLISWDDYRYDIPLLDIVNLFKNDNIYNNFKVFLDSYFNEIDYEEDEKKLLFILLSLPDYIDENDSLDLLRNNINRIKEIESTIRPYYLKDKEK